MGPARSSSLRIGDDSSVIVSSGQARDAPDRSAVVEIQDVPEAPNVPEAPPLPLGKGKGKINLINTQGVQITSHPPSRML